MTINIEELKRDREAGTPGEWEWNEECGYYSLSPGIFISDTPDGTPWGDRIDQANARRIARLPDLEAAFLEAVERQERQYHVGPLTFDRVFRAGQLENLYDMQAVLDAVERALEAE